jgi:TonB family protein
MDAQRRNPELQRRWRRVWWTAMLVSAGVHLALFLLFRADIVAPPSPFSAAGPRSGDPNAAAGGGMQAVAMRIRMPEAPQPIPRPPAPLPVPAEEVVEVEEVEPAVVEQPDANVGPVTVDATAGTGTAPTPGVPGGTGAGDGGTAAEGLFRVIPPAPKGLIMPPNNPPRKVRGREVDVWVFVTDQGRVVDDSTRVLPSTGDRSFDSKLRERAAQWVFEPAKRGGRPVAEWFRYTIIL